MFVATLRRNRSAPLLGGDDLLDALRRSHPGHTAGSAGDGHFVGAQSLLRTTPESRREKVPHVDRRTGRMLLSWLRLDNRSELARDLGWQRDHALAATDPDYVVAAYDKWGVACVERLEGDFAFVLWDPLRGGVLAARDSAGVRPLFYADTPEVLACSTTTVCLSVVAGLDLSVRAEWLAQYMHGQSANWGATPFHGVSKLPPGHFLWADAGGTQVTRYHRFEDDAPWEDRRDERWLRAYRDRLETAITARIRTDDPIGVENSGGLDSATMVCFIPYLQPRHRAEMHTYGFALEALEPRYIALTDHAAGVVHSRQWSTWESRDDLNRLGWSALGYPVEHANAISHIGFIEAAREAGVRTLHSGHGGDEVVTQAARHAVHESLRRRRYVGLLRDLPGPVVLRPARLARHWVRTRRPVRSHLEQPLMRRLAGTPLRTEAFESADIEGITYRRAQYDAPFDTVNSFILGDRWSSATSTRTADCSVVAAAFGVEYVWPLLDRRLMQQYLSTPTVWKFGEGYGRYLHRRAVAGVVPELVAWKRSKDMSAPAGPADRGADIPRPGPPDRGHDELNPAVASLIDPAAWRRGPLPGLDRLAAEPYRSAIVLSDWLDSRG